ncbi:MAG: hypothetical protein KF819_33975 [Labilithrix sp.]|nr:hypothetical protein [Labilithrix sp.]
MNFSNLQHCMEIRGAQIVEAAGSSESMTSLLARFTQIAAPGRGAPIILAALARLATTACDWIDGELRIEVSGDDASTKIVVSSSIGAGFREKLFPDTVLRVPFSEFSRGIARAPKVIAPLTVKESGKRIVLTASAEVRKTSLPPPMVQIDPSSFMEVPKLAVPKTPPDTVGLPPAPVARPAARRTSSDAPVLKRRVRDDD